MHASASRIRKSFSPAAASRGARGEDCRSPEGGPHYHHHPTDAHKRQQLSNAGANAGRDACVRQVDRTAGPPFCDTENRVATSPSSAGLSRSPSQPTVHAKQTLGGHRSVSQPLSATLSKPEADTQILPAAAFVKHGAPLLHRYRTSQANSQRRASPRSASSPARARQLPSSSVNGHIARQPTKYIRRSLLRKPTALHFNDDIGSSPLLEQSTSLRSSLESHPSVSVEGAVMQAPSERRAPIEPSFRPERVAASGTRVPVTRVRLMEPGQPVNVTESVDTSKGATSGPSRDGTRVQQDPSRKSAVTETNQLPDTVLVTPGSSSGRTEPHNSTTPPPGGRHLNALTSKDATRTSFCSDERCMHSEQSIGEFILMQRELRRCYAALDDYEVVVAQLRQECTSTWAAYRQLQQQCVQREEEVEAAVRAELTEQMNIARGKKSDSVQKSEEGDEKQSAEPNNSVEDADVQACLETTWREALEELQHAFQAEKAAHAATRRELDEALTTKKRWKARATELHRWRSRVCQRLEDSSPGPTDTPDKHIVETAFGSAQVSLSRSPSCHPPDDKHHEGFHSSNESLPAPRFHSPPHPHQAPFRQHADVAAVNYGVEDLSALSALTDESEAKAAAVEARESCAVENPIDIADRSAESEAHSSDLSLGIFASGTTTAAVGGGTVMIESQHVEERAGQSATLIIQASPQQLSSRSPAQTASAPGAVTEAARGTEEEEDGEGSLTYPSALTFPQADAGRTCVRAHAPEAGCLAVLLENLTQAAKREQQQQLQQLAFPPPPAAEASDVHATHRAVFTPWSTRTTVVASTVTVGSAERKCKELLCALLDKERQLAVMAAERTRFKRLYEEQTQGSLLGSC
ncbi:hypothetical protein ABL78_3941 [Leptomonas seymouri]|uniref:Uncharacterized protein n=1 Tax=Leptomonas seymouri TaxID=5684 RepID=A0A0N1I5F7_LEPSE|nr:hypothetical protein ABL78_3941 [Leptomonas seymouri]|eukprot:KPI86988.1 hypothetical protein ABL78_3941 [Leptomonas seymouri]